MALLLGVQTTLIEPNYRKSLFKLEKRLDRELQDILDQEELYWRQQARANGSCTVKETLSFSMHVPNQNGGNM